jgi:transcriptional regulator GlxA family with amidase domain
VNGLHEVEYPASAAVPAMTFRPQILPDRIPPNVKRVLFLAVPPIQILDLTGPFEVFARCGGYEVELASSTHGPIASSCGLTLTGATYFLEVTGPVDTIIVPGGGGAEELHSTPEFLDWLRRLSQTARRVCSICTGAFVLAQAGLLDDRMAVTHWNWCERLATRFPRVRVQQAPLFVKDGAYYSSGGVTAGMDLALALVEEDQGAAKSAKIAQDLVMFLRRGASHSQFSSFLATQPSPNRAVEDLCAWIADHLDADLSVPKLAEHCHMSPRHFARVFRREKGVTPARFVEQLRLSVAHALLGSEGASAKQVAAITGFGSPDSMRRALGRAGKTEV